MSSLPKAYNPSETESDIYRRWDESGFFNPDNLPPSKAGSGSAGNAKKRKPYTIAMPPPNITGELHVGHILGFTIQDILIRYYRMRGRAALWIPGTDHAAISTQVMVERELRRQGIDRFTIGRAKFLKHVWAWKEKYGRRIVEQIVRSGASADWSREHFTLDDDLTAAVHAAFKRLYDDGLIYRGERIINWCVDCQTAISDLEVEHEDVPGKLWYLDYPLQDGSGQVTVATTRPETMLGDTAVAVHPHDDRYRAMVGKMLILPITSRVIPIIGDSRIDREFGTGAVKVTPAHDSLDFDLGRDHKLPSITIIGQDGKMTAAAGPEFSGLTVVAAREKVLVALRAAGALQKEEDHIHAVGFCSRTKTVVEPLVSLQWFVEAKPLAKKAIQAVRSGKITILPKRFEKVFFHWLENIKDWNISRQIWWGHRLPVWYKKSDHTHENPKVSVKSPGAGWVQDEDTLDTWFSAGLWTFSTLGWPKKTADLKRFHPTDVMETGWDILFFWVARMMMLSLYLLDEVPFRTVYLHGLILDADGKKMSKSKGTGLDPLPLADKYGMDALRMSLIIGNAPGQDFRIYEKKIEGYRNFANKLWNVSRFILHHSRPSGQAKPTSLADEWILAKLQETTGVVANGIEHNDLSTAGQRLYEFVWHEFADWYLEASKIAPNPSVLYAVLETTLKLLHPFMPFITERLWHELDQESLLLIAPWPKTVKLSAKNRRIIKQFQQLQRTVVALRNFKVHSALPGGAAGQFVGTLDAELVSSLAGVVIQVVKRLPVVSGYRTVLLGDEHFQFPAEFVDRYESWRQKERQQLEAYQAAIEKKLANENFVAHAPAEVIAQERQKLAAAKQRLLEL